MAYDARNGASCIIYRVQHIKRGTRQPGAAHVNLGATQRVKIGPTGLKIGVATMFDVKRHETALSSARKRRAELDRGLQPLRQAREVADKAHADLQAEAHSIRVALRDFEAGLIDMTDDEFMRSRARLDLLGVRMKRAAETAAAARQALQSAETAARSELSALWSTALSAWRDDVRTAEAELTKAWVVL